MKIIQVILALLAVMVVSGCVMTADYPYDVAPYRTRVMTPVYAPPPPLYPIYLDPFPLYWPHHIGHRGHGPFRGR